MTWLARFCRWFSGQEYVEIDGNEAKDVGSTGLHTSGQQSIVTFLAFMGFGISSWIMSNAFYIELGVFQRVLPERYSVGAYAIFALQLANVYPFLYMLVEARHPNFPIHRVIWVLLAVALLDAIFMSACWNKTTAVGGSEYSIAVFVLTHFAGMVGATSNVAFFPYVARYLPIFTSALSTGEGLSGSVVAVLGLLQQPFNEHLQFSVTTFYYVCVFFIIIAAISFAFLEKHPWAKAQLSTAWTEPHDEPSGVSTTIVDPESIPLNAPAPASSARSKSAFHLVWSYLACQFVLATFAFGVIPSLMPFVYKKYAPLNDVALSTARYQTIATVLALVFDPMARLLTSCLRVYRVREMTVVLCIIGCFLTVSSLQDRPLLSTTAHGFLLPIAGHAIYLVGYAYTQTMLLFSLGRVSASSAVVDATRVYQWCGFATQLGAFLGTVVIFPLVFFREDLFL